MQILNVYHSGIDKLVDTYKATKNMEGKMTFSSKSNTFFENMEISLKLYNVKAIELIYLRKFCSNIIFLGNNDPFMTEPEKITDVCLVKPTVPSHEYNERLEALNHLANEIKSNIKYLSNQDSELRHTDFFDCADIGSLRFNILARFEGVNVVTLLDAFPEYTLRNEKYEYIEPGTKEFTNLIAKLFVKNFYSYVKNDLAAHDVVTDVRFNELYLDDVIGTDSMLTHIRTPFGEFDWKKYDSENEFMLESAKIKSEAGKSKYSVNPYTDFTLYYAVSAPMHVFLRFILNTNLVYYHTDLKVLVGTKSTINSDNIIANPKNSVNVRGVFEDTVNDIDNFRLNALSEINKYNEALKKDKKSNVIPPYSETELYNFIPRSANIKFMIRGTIDELKSQISNLNCNYSGLQNGLLVHIGLMESMFGITFR